MRKLFLFFAAVLFAFAASAQTPSCATPGTDNAFLGIQTVRLWPGTAPEAKGATCDDIPALTIFEPRQGSANGSAVIIFPGGAYVHLAGDLEGREVADWFTARGFRAFILSYRLASHGYLLPVPLIDARRAIQTIRAAPSTTTSIPTALSSSDSQPAAILPRWRERSLFPGTPMPTTPSPAPPAAPTISSLATHGSAPSRPTLRT